MSTRGGAAMAKKLQAKCHAADLANSCLQTWQKPDESCKTIFPWQAQHPIDTANGHVSLKTGCATRGAALWQGRDAQGRRGNRKVLAGAVISSTDVGSGNRTDVHSPVTGLQLRSLNQLTIIQTPYDLVCVDITLLKFLNSKPGWSNLGPRRSENSIPTIWPAIPWHPSM